jgi:hypothetical protein
MKTRMGLKSMSNMIHITSLYPQGTHTHTSLHGWIFFMNTIKLFNNIQFQTLKLSKRGKKIECKHMYLISIL